MTLRPLAAAALLLLATASGARQNPWRHEGSLWIVTTPDGANLPADASVENFPLLVRLTRENFPFDQAQPRGQDIRFSTPDGVPLPHEIERWDPRAGRAEVWVRIPRIRGDALQEIRLRWGNPDAPDASRGEAVFTPDAFAGVWHLSPDLGDATGATRPTDRGTADTPGAVGAARRFSDRAHIRVGERLDHLPTDGAPHTTQAWIRAERPNATVVGWGNEQAQGKVVLQLRGPTYARVDAYFSDAGVASRSRLPLDRWVHVVHTYEKGDARVYVDGVLDGAAKASGAPLRVRRPAQIWIGGWVGDGDFVGAIDEVRVSRVARSPEWIRLEYENQKPHQSLVGSLVAPGDRLAVDPPRLSLREGGRATLAATVGGARKLTWRDGDRVLAVDTPTIAVEAGRTTGDQTRTIRLTALTPDGPRNIDIPVAVREAIPDPQVSLAAPPRWDGRSAVDVVATVDSPVPARTTWRVDGPATVREVRGDTLRLIRAQNSGPLTVAVTVDNGGTPVTRRVEIAVREPRRDPWIARVPDPDERPEDHAFIPRDPDGRALLHHNGVLDAPADAVVLRVFADDRPYRTLRAKPGPDRAYRFAVPLRPGLIRYRTELAAVTGGRETPLHRADDLVCGDVYLVNGQSNAVATDFGRETPDFRSPWIRTFGKTWGEARHRGGDGEIGYWAMELARQLVETHRIPVCILNGAVGGTRIDQHQRDPRRPDDPETIYGRLLGRVRRARLTHGVRAILWHQGENDQGADGPTGGFGWETYRDLFVDLAAGWKRDYPNVRRYYVFQIWPRSCGMGIDGSDNRLREVQRTLPAHFSQMRVLSTLGITPPGGCHFPAAGYAAFARMVAPLIERDFFGRTFPAPITPPNLRAASRPDPRTLVLEFDQPVLWSDALRGEFAVDGRRGRIAAGRAQGDRLILTLTDPGPVGTVSYLDSAAWSQERLLRGANGMAALTFCEVPVAAAVKGRR